jgi:O-antigen/teichoic acid export membrane protein
VMVVQLLGPAQGAYILPAQTIVTALNLLSGGLTSALVVEAVRDESQARVFAMAVLRRIAVTVVPAALFIAAVAPWLLELFGPQYRAAATLLLQLLMVSTVPRVVVLLYSTLCRLQNRTGRLALLQFAQAVILVGGTVALVRPLGLVAVGWAGLAAQLVPALALTPAVVRWMRSSAPPTAGATPEGVRP